MSTESVFFIYFTTIVSILYFKMVDETQILLQRQFANFPTNVHAFAVEIPLQGIINTFINISMKRFCPKCVMECAYYSFLYLARIGCKFCDNFYFSDYNF